MRGTDGASPKARRQARLLVAEDDALVREAVCMRLSTAGYEVHTARSGKEALERILTLKPDALLLDINLPGMDGFEVLEALRTGMPDLVLPTLVLTQRQAAEDVKRALALGARDYLVKTSLGEQLPGRVARLLKPQGGGRCAA